MDASDPLPPRSNEPEPAPPIPPLFGPDGTGIELVRLRRVWVWRAWRGGKLAGGGVLSQPEAALRTGLRALGARASGANALGVCVACGHPVGWHPVAGTQSAAAELGCLECSCALDAPRAAGVS